MADLHELDTRNRGAAPGAAPGVRFSPPPDHAISVRARRSRDLRAADQSERVQSLPGFEDTYVDIVDYVIRITDRIWEDQDVGYIYDTYRAGCRVYDDSGPKYGVERVVEETMQSIHALPRQPALRRRRDLGGERGRGVRHLAPGDQRGPPSRSVALGRADGQQDPPLGDR